MSANFIISVISVSIYIGWFFFLIMGHILYFYLSIYLVISDWMVEIMFYILCAALFFNVLEILDFILENN